MQSSGAYTGGDQAAIPKGAGAMMFSSSPRPFRVRPGLSAIAALVGLALLAAAPARAEKSAHSRLDDILKAVVKIDAKVPANARSAKTLGTDRTGNGIVIDTRGLVLTIGYLILEASEITVTSEDGTAVPAEFVAYDYDTGFGLVRVKRQLDIKPISFGDSKPLKAREAVVIVGFGGRSAVRPAVIASRRDFAGYWEYLLEGALFTTPVYRNFGGAALLDLQGNLVGVGSLAVGDAAGPGRPVPGNMFVPIEKLKPILADLLNHGRSSAPPRPWIGVITREVANGRVVVALATPDAPAARAGMRRGDIVMAVDGSKVSGQIDFYRKLWAAGRPGSTIAVTVQQGDEVKTLTIKAGDRYRWLKLPSRRG
jgi:S1-C subfamily serine protease